MKIKQNNKISVKIKARQYHRKGKIQNKIQDKEIN